MRRSQITSINKAFTFITILISACTNLAGQSKSVSIATNQMDSDTSIYYHKAMKLKEIYHLSDLKTSCYKFHFRLCTPEQVIELFYNDTAALKGHVMYYTESLRSENKKVKHYSKTIRYGTERVKQLLFLTDSFDIINLPSDEKIDCWFTLGE